VSIDGNRVSMRSGPGEKNAVLWELDRGYPLQVIGSQGKWLKVSDFEGDVGWVWVKNINNDPHCIVKRKMINLRSGPGSHYKLVGKAKQGVVLEILTQGDNGWVKVRHANGMKGWASRNFLWGW
ncbi:MAG: SH3 domain-containing protein, partial [Desulfobulbaceae bacterium]|nr:SH3 domain-containing protein [Desulfobulbaceae bacterium]